MFYFLTMTVVTTVFMLLFFVSCIKHTCFMHFLVCVMFQCVCVFTDKNMEITRKHKAKMLSLICLSRDNRFFDVYLSNVLRTNIYHIFYSCPWFQILIKVYTSIYVCIYLSLDFLIYYVIIFWHEVSGFCWIKFNSYIEGHCLDIL